MSRRVFTDVVLKTIAPCQSFLLCLINQELIISAIFYSLLVATSSLSCHPQTYHGCHLPIVTSHKCKWYIISFRVSLPEELQLQCSSFLRRHHQISPYRCAEYGMISKVCWLVAREAGLNWWTSLSCHMRSKAYVRKHGSKTSFSSKVASILPRFDALELEWKLISEFE